MPTLTADQILAADDLGLKKLSVPEWGGEVYVRVMSVGERDAYEKLWIGKKDSGVDNFRTEYLARVLCNDKGELLFSRTQIDALLTPAQRTQLATELAKMPPPDEREHRRR